MDTIVIGNLCKDPTLHQALRTGRPVAKLKVATNPRRWDGSTWIARPPVFHDVVCFGDLAENVTNSLRAGMDVFAVGEWADNSYTDELGNRRIRIVLEAKTVGPNLRWATAVVQKTERRPKPEQPTLTAAPDPPTEHADRSRQAPTEAVRPRSRASGSGVAIKPPEPIPAGTG